MGEGRTQGRPDAEPKWPRKVKIEGIMMTWEAIIEESWGKGTWELSATSHEAVTHFFFKKRFFFFFKKIRN